MNFIRWLAEFYQFGGVYGGRIFFSEFSAVEKNSAEAIEV